MRLSLFAFFFFGVSSIGSLAWASPTCDTQSESSLVKKCNSVCTCDDRSKDNKCNVGGKVSSGGSVSLPSDAARLQGGILSSQDKIRKIREKCEKSFEKARTSCASSQDPKDRESFKNSCEQVAKERIKETKKAEKNAEKDQEKAKKAGEQAKNGGGEQPPQMPQQNENKPLAQNDIDKPLEKKEEVKAAVAQAPPTKTVRQPHGAKSESEYEKLVAAGACSIDHTDCSSEKTRACGQDSGVKACCEGPLGKQGKNASFCAQELVAIDQRAFDATERDPGSASGGASLNASGSKVSGMLDETGKNKQAFDKKLAAEMKEKEKKKKAMNLLGESGGLGGGGGSFGSSGSGYAGDENDPGTPGDNPSGYSAAGFKRGGKPILNGPTQNVFHKASMLMCRLYKKGQLIQARGHNHCALFPKR